MWTVTHNPHFSINLINIKWIVYNYGLKVVFQSKGRWFLEVLSNGHLLQGLHGCYNHEFCTEAWCLQVQRGCISFLQAPPPGK